MKKPIIWLLAMTIVVTMIFIGVGCKTNITETTVAETTVAETTVAETTVAETTTAEKVTLKFWLYGGMQEGINWSKNKVDQWNSEHPNIQVNITPQSWETMFDHFKTAASTDTMPDIARIHGSMLNYYGTEGYLEPLNNFSDFGEFKNNFITGYVDPIKVKGQLYGIPNQGMIFILMGNKKLLNDAGYQELPTTWAELKEVAKKLTKDTNGDGKVDQWGYELFGADGGNFAYRFVEYMFKAGGDFLNEDWTKSLVTEKPWEEALQLFVDLKKDGSLDPAFLATDFDGETTKIAENQAAMWLEGPFILDPILAKNPDIELLFGAVPAPSEAFGPFPQGTIMDINAVVMSNSCKNKEAAWEFIKWYTGPDNDKDCVLDPKIGGLPVCNASMDIPEWKNIPGFAAYQAESPTLRYMPPQPNLIELTSQGFGPVFLKAINGEISVQDALTQAASNVDTILARK